MLAFDCTYVTSSLAAMSLRSQRGMAGGVWLEDFSNNAWLPLSETMDVTSIKKASVMLECLLWDPSSTYKVPISAMAMPVEHNFAGAFGQKKSNLYMASLMGQVLKASDGLVSGMVGVVFGYFVGPH